jgi:hypothetical protein
VKKGDIPWPQVPLVRAEIEKNKKSIVESKEVR